MVSTDEAAGRRSAHEAARDSARAPSGGRTAKRGDAAFPPSPILAANVAQVPQRSPLRYPGGKTWLIPHIRAWLRETVVPHRLIVEPFAGGAVVSLTAVMEGLADRALLVERDPDVAAFWRAALEHGDALMARVREFTPSREAVERLANGTPRDMVEHGFRTLVLNRMRWGGVLAPGAALVKRGENGHGTASRWYPETLIKRLRAIRDHADRLSFYEGDGARLLRDKVSSGQWPVASDRRPTTGARSPALFIDPPYTAAGGKRAGARLYAHHTIDHAALFATLAESGTNFLMTYDCSDEITALVRRHGFHAETVTMKNSHYNSVKETIIATVTGIFKDSIHNGEKRTV